MSNSALALEALLTRYENLFKNTNSYNLPCIELSPPWPSPCIKHQDEDSYYWQHAQKDEANIFNQIEDAIEIKFHADIHSFYSSFWSNGIRVEHPSVDFALIQTWNEEDQENLKENILGHCFAKLKARLPLTIFIGCTDNNEVISIDNESGEIVLERPGKKAHKILATDLESFLLSLTPTTEQY